MDFMEFKFLINSEKKTREMVIFVSESFAMIKENYNPLCFDWNRNDIKPAKHFLQIYRELFGNESSCISKFKYGRQKNQVLQAMTKSELLQDYGKDHDLHNTMTKQEMIKQLKRTDVRFWVYV